MTAPEAFQLVTSSGVLAGSLKLLKWELTVERRLMKIEVKKATRRFPAFQHKE
jgi:hypothetical protein